MIEFQQVSKRYDAGFDVLKRVSFEIDSGEMVFLTGHSGAGKSTLLKLIMMMEHASKGRVLVNGHDLSEAGRKHIPYHRRQIGMVFQNHQLLFDRSVFDNVALPLVIMGYNYREIGRRVHAALDKVGLLDKETQNPITLSGGQQQRVGIARAVVHKPTILLADEPTGNLDPELSAEIMYLFEQFNHVGTTVLLASHDVSLIASMKHRMLTLSGGEMILGDGHGGQ